MLDKKGGAVAVGSAVTSATAGGEKLRRQLSPEDVAKRDALRQKAQRAHDAALLALQLKADRGDSGCIIRPLGRDRHKRLYWHFPLEKKLLVQTVRNETTIDFFIDIVSEWGDAAVKPSPSLLPNSSARPAAEGSDAAVGVGVASSTRPPSLFDSEPTGETERGEPSDRNLREPSAAVDPSSTTEGALPLTSPPLRAPSVPGTTAGGVATFARAPSLGGSVRSSDAVFCEWGYVPLEQLEPLIASLDGRGAREGMLKTALTTLLPLAAHVVAQVQEGVNMRMTRSRAAGLGYVNKLRPQPASSVVW